MDPLPIIPEPPRSPPLPTKKPFPVVGIFIGFFFFILLGLLFYQQLQIRTLLQAQSAITVSETPTQPPDLINNWITYTDPVLHIEYKLPPNLAGIDGSGQEIPGDIGSQYCLQYVYSEPQSMQFVKKVFAGTGPCADGDLVIGTTSINYTAGREGGFGDLQGYMKKNDAYSARFVSGGTFALPEGSVSEVTNTNGVTYLKITGINKIRDLGGEQMSTPVLGTPGEGMLGALVNITNDKYSGFNIQMKINSTKDEKLFDQILSTFTFTQ